MQHSVGLAFAVALAAACGSSAPDHSAVVARARVAVTSVDLAPVQLALALEPGAHASIAQVQSTAAAQLGNLVIAALESRAYAVRASGRPTGADATLYVSGRSFVPAPRPSRANANAEAVAFNAVGVVATAAALTTAGALDATPREGSSGYALEDGIGVALMIAEETAFTVTAHAEPPAPVADRPPAMGPPQLQLRLTLVDNRTGRVLWQVQDRFAANAAQARELARAVTTLLGTLPPPAPRS